MRWMLFLLLAIALLASVAALLPAPAGNAGPLWPFAADTRVLPGFAGATPVLAAVAAVCYAAAMIGLFRTNVSVPWWNGLVGIGAVTSLLLFVTHFGPPMVLPLLAVGALIGGTLTGRWAPAVRRMHAVQQAAGGHPGLMRIPVPWVYVLTYVAGLGLQVVAPIVVRSPSLLRAGTAAGAVLSLLGAGLALPSLGMFRRARTTTVPFETPSRLVTHGPFRFTRNPMYLGLLVWYVGIAAMQGRVWPLLLLPLLWIYLQRVVIPVEEARLRETFGAAYGEYCARVRRWI